MLFRISNADFISFTFVENYIKKIANGTIAQSQIYEKTVEFNAGIGIDFTTDFVSERDKNLFEKRMYDRRNLLTGPTDAEYAEQLLKNIDFAKREIKYLNELSEISYYGLIKAKLDEGLEFTNIDFKAYDNLSNNKQSAVMGKMTSQTFTDGDALKDYFDKLVKNPPSTDGGNSDGKFKEGDVPTLSGSFTYGLLKGKVIEMNDRFVRILRDNNTKRLVSLSTMRYIVYDGESREKVRTGAWSDISTITDVGDEDASIIIFDWNNTNINWCYVIK